MRRALLAREAPHDKRNSTAHWKAGVQLARFQTTMAMIMLAQRIMVSSVGLALITLLHSSICCRPAARHVVRTSLRVQRKQPTAGGGSQCSLGCLARSGKFKGAKAASQSGRHR